MNGCMSPCQRPVRGRHAFFFRNHNCNYNHKRMLRAIYVVIVLVLLGVRADLVVQTVNGTQYNISSIQIIYQGNPTPLIDSPIYAPTTTDMDAVDGHIYVIRTSSPAENQIASAQEKGAIAVVVISPTYLVSGYLTYRMNDRSLAQSLSIPVFEVPVRDGRILWSLVTSDQILNVTIQPDVVENPWTVAFSSGGVIFRAVVLCAFSLANIGLAIWKIVTFVQYYGGFRSSIAFYVLTIEIISNALRVVSAIETGGDGLYPEWAVVFLSEISYPFALSSYLLFTLYWHELMTNATVSVHPFITKMRIPFFVLSAVLLCLQIIRTVIRSVTPFDSLNIVTAVVYMAVLISLVIFYAVTGAKILKRLSTSKKMGRTVQLGRTTRRILVGGSFFIVWVLVAILFVSGIVYQPVGMIVVGGVLYVVLDVASLLNILAFEVPLSSSSKQSKNTSKKPMSAHNSTASAASDTTPGSAVLRDL